MGLKIVQALLTNEPVWQISIQKFPILVVCYTNHALDQFLEGNICRQNCSLLRVLWWSMVRIMGFTAVAQVHSLVRELKFHKPHSTAEKINFSFKTYIVEP